MSTLSQLHPQAVQRAEPSKLSTTSTSTSTSRNPFARPKLASVPQSGSFTRATLLPSIFSPARTASDRSSDSSSTLVNGLTTPIARPTTPGVGSAVKQRSGWRLLWRGGLEIGREGWRLDGITFFAHISFPPSTPSGSNNGNPFDVPIQSFPTPGATSSVAIGAPLSSPFPAFPSSADTDLCLSLESMRGRKYLQVRGLIPLPDDEVLDGASTAEEGGAGVQMAVSEQAPLLAAYFIGLLCRDAKVSPQGRTLNAIVIGLGDEGIDTASNSSILVYGQRQDGEASGEGRQGILRLCVARRKPPPAPPSAKKVRPGEPLPRAPLFFPAKAPKRPPPPFPSRSLSRTASINSSIYHPPPISSSASAPAVVQVSTSQDPAPVSGRTPGRRGEKRPRKLELDEGENERRRKAGRVVLDQRDGDKRESGAISNTRDEEDIFGKRAASIPNSASASIHLPSSNREAVDHDSELDTPTESVLELGTIATNPLLTAELEQTSTSRAKRVRVPQQILDNKAAIRKQTLVLLEGRGISRTHDTFKDVFGMTTKGTYFAFRDKLQEAQLPKVDIHRIINTHLDMYLDLQSSPAPRSPPFRGSSTDKEESDTEMKPELLIKVDTSEVVKEEYSEVKLEGTFFHHDQRIKLQAVQEEDEAEEGVKEEDGDEDEDEDEDEDA